MPTFPLPRSLGRPRPEAFRAAAAALLALAPAPAAAQAVLLEGIVVSASRSPLPAGEVGSSVTVITGEDLERRGEPRAAETLRRVPGLAVSSSGGPGQLTQLRIRGAEANHTLVIIDGIEVSDPSAGSEFYLDSLTNDGIGRIEVLRGPQSAIYGSDAIGGVVRIETLAPGGPPRLSADAEAGSLGTARASVSGTVSSGRASFSGGVGVLRTDGISAADRRDGNPEDDGHEIRSLRARAEVALTERITLDAALLDISSDVELDGGFPFADNADRAKRHERHLRTSAEWRGGDGLAHVRATLARSAKESDNFGSNPRRTEGWRTKVSLEAGVPLPSLAGGRIAHSVDLALERERERQTVSCASRIFCPNNGAARTQGYAAEYRVGLAERLFVSASLRHDRRHDRNRRRRDATTERLAASWLFPGSGTRLHTSLGTGVKNPTLTELHGLGDSFVGNPDLEPEKGTGWDIGLGQELLSGRLALDFTGFRNRIQNLIDGCAVYDPSRGCITAANRPGTTRSEGIELALRAELLPELSLRGGWTAMRTREPNDRERIRHPRHAWTVGLDGDFQIAGLLATGVLELHRTGRQRDISSPMPLGSFSLLAASLSVEATDRVSIFVRGENLLDEHYQEVIGYGAPGLTAFVGIRIASGDP